MRILFLSLAFAVGVVTGGALVWWKISDEYWEDQRWSRLVGIVESQPNRIPKELEALVASHKDFPAASNSCASNARDLLRINRIGAGDIRDLGSNRAWERKVALFVSSLDATQKPYVFLCLLDANLKLERTRLVYPRIGGKDPALEIGPARMLDVQF